MLTLYLYDLELNLSWIKILCLMLCLINIRNSQVLRNMSFSEYEFTGNIILYGLDDKHKVQDHKVLSILSAINHTHTAFP